MTDHRTCTPSGVLRPCARRVEIARRHVAELEADASGSGALAELARLELPAARAFLRLAEDIAEAATVERCAVGGAA